MNKKLLVSAFLILTLITSSIGAAVFEKYYGDAVCIALNMCEKGDFEEFREITGNLKGKIDELENANKRKIELNEELQKLQAKDIEDREKMNNIATVLTDINIKGKKRNEQLKEYAESIKKVADILRTMSL